VPSTVILPLTTASLNLQLRIIPSSDQLLGCLMYAVWFSRF